MDTRAEIKKSNSRGFTLIELLVVISIIGVISSVALVNMGGARQSAEMAQSKTFASGIQQKIGIDLIGAWDLDEGLGTVAKDTSGMNNNGTLTNSPAWVAATNCVTDECLSFDGVDDYVRINAALSLSSIHGPSTLEVWFKPSALPAGNKMIFSDNCLEWGVYHNGTTLYGQAYWAVNGGTIDVNKWYHVVVAHDHPTGITNTKVRLYINGKPRGENTGTITTHNGYTDSPYYIGADGCTAGTNFSGLIDSVRIYSTALNLTAVRDRYLAGMDSLLKSRQLTETEYRERLAELDPSRAINK